MHVILTGATGLIGSAVFHQMLNTEGISRISILSRRPVAMSKGHEDKAKVIIHEDFLKYDEALLEQLKDAQGVVWSLGVSQNAVTKDKYVEITHDYTIAAAEAFSTLHPDSPFTFVFVSGEGATQTPGPFTAIYGRVKGRTEQSLFDLGRQKPNLKVYNVRPAVVDWRAHPEIHPFLPQLPAYRKLLMPAFSSLYTSFHTPTRELGKVLTELATSRGEPVVGKDTGMEGRMLPNVVLRRLGGL